MISEITSEDLSAFVTKLLDSRPSLASYGDGAEAARYDVLLARYGGSSAMKGSSPYDRGGVQTSPSTTDRLKQALGISQWK